MRNRLAFSMGLVCRAKLHYFGVGHIVKVESDCGYVGSLVGDSVDIGGRSNRREAHSSSYE